MRLVVDAADVVTRLAVAAANIAPGLAVSAADVARRLAVVASDVVARLADVDTRLTVDAVNVAARLAFVAADVANRLVVGGADTFVHPGVATVADVDAFADGDVKLLFLRENVLKGVCIWMTSVGVPDRGGVDSFSAEKTPNPTPRLKIGVGDLLARFASGSSSSSFRWGSVLFTS